MMYLQYRVFGFALAYLTGMIVSIQHIFPDVPEARLLSILVFLA
jgi:hypothetical protein